MFLDGGSHQQMWVMRAEKNLDAFITNAKPFENYLLMPTGLCLFPMMDSLDSSSQKGNKNEEKSRIQNDGMEWNIGQFVGSDVVQKCDENTPLADIKTTAPNSVTAVHLELRPAS